MVKDNINIREANGVSQKELLETLAEGREVSKELQEKLSKIRLNIDKNKNPEIINAIFLIFGESYINRSGNAVITYDMYCATLNLIRTLGKTKAQEVI